MRKWSNILSIIGFGILVVGAVMSLCSVEPWANYVLIAGAAVIVIRGALRVRDK